MKAFLKKASTEIQDHDDFSEDPVLKFGFRHNLYYCLLVLAALCLCVCVRDIARLLLLEEDELKPMSYFDGDEKVYIIGLLIFYSIN
mmetsp:Transcript_41680/g.48111  ORF Transcript_41680/g.48111 Transcript_41680/m.48111 type:complete len:87 (+) Transcript_41680:250-510(+)